MKGRGKIFILAGSLGVLLIAFLFVFKHAKENQKSTWFPVFSSYYTDDHGTHALYNLMEESSEFEVDRNFLPLTDRRDYGSKNYVFIAPYEDFSLEEIDSLEKEIRAGAHAIVCVKRNNNFLENWGIHTRHTRSREKYIRGNTDLRPSRLGQLIGDDEPTRYLRREYPDVYSATAINEEFAYYYASDSLPLLPYYEGDSGEVHIAWHGHGEGALLLVSNPHLFTNSGLRFPTNVSLTHAIFRTVLESHRAPFIFDEYHHGFHISQVSTPLTIPEVRYMIWGLIATLILVIWSYSRRDRKAIPVNREPRRSISEFVSSMARIYHRKGGTPALYAEVVLRFRARLRVSLGISEEALKSHDKLMKAAEMKWGPDEATSLSAIMKSIRDARATGKGLLPTVQKIRSFAIRNKIDLHV